MNPEGGNTRTRMSSLHPSAFIFQPSRVPWPPKEPGAGGDFFATSYIFDCNASFKGEGASLAPIANPGA